MNRLPLLPKEANGHIVYDPLKQYRITDIDTAAGYYGYTDTLGQWYILELTSTTARYCRGLTGYTTAWTNRATNTYAYLYEVF